MDETFEPFFVVYVVRADYLGITYLSLCFKKVLGMICLFYDIASKLYIKGVKLEK